MMTVPIPPLGRLNSLLIKPYALVRCRWCGDRLLKINNAYLCGTCDCPDPSIVIDDKELPNV